MDPITVTQTNKNVTLTIDYHDDNNYTITHHNKTKGYTIKYNRINSKSEVNIHVNDLGVMPYKSVVDLFTKMSESYCNFQAKLMNEDGVDK